MESQILYDAKADLDLPPDVQFKSIDVMVEMTPRDGGCLIYGVQPNGAVGCVEVRGSIKNVRLPFATPEIYVKFLKGLTEMTISTRGCQLSQR